MNKYTMRYVNHHHSIRFSVWLSICFFLFMISCKKSSTNGDIPNVNVQIYIPLSLPEYSSLNSIGNSMTISGGVKGIILYRRSVDEFGAYERCCPYDPQISAAIVEIDSNRVIGVDRHCGSKFSLYDGSIINGPSTRSLKPYAADYEASTQTVFIHN